MSTITPLRRPAPVTDVPTPPRRGSLPSDLVATARQSLEGLVDTFELNRIDTAAAHGPIPGAAYDVGLRSAVHEALHDLATGRYGGCNMCGDQIDVERLRSIPYGRRCATCQQVEERRWNQIERTMASVIRMRIGEPQGRLPVPLPDGDCSHRPPDAPRGDR